MLKQLLTLAPLLASTIFAVPILDHPDVYGNLLALTVPGVDPGFEESFAPPATTEDTQRLRLKSRDEIGPDSPGYEALVGVDPTVEAPPVEVVPVVDAGLPADAPAEDIPATDVAATEAPSSELPAPELDVELDAADDSVIELESSPPAPEHIDPRAPGYRNALYYSSWSIYKANYQPQQLPTNKVTHLLYAFARPMPDGTVVPGDSFADVEKHYATDSWSETGNNAYGCVKQLYLHKMKNRKLKTLLSIGGWTWKDAFPSAASTAANRKRFASTAVKLIADWGMDGIDIDWEYPQNAQEANNYVLLLKEVRVALDNFSSANKLNYRFDITIASPAGAPQYNIMKLGAMNAYVDMWHLMAYDYAGSWDTTTGHASNLFLSQTNKASTKYSTDAAINDYIRAGVPAYKITMGLPLYGRSFANTNGLGQPYSGVGGGSLEQGVYLFKDLPRPGLGPLVDKTIVATYTYDGKTKELVTYDGVASTKIKADYVKRRGLGGAFFWEAVGDKKGDMSLVKVMADGVGVLDSATNNLLYPTSQYRNIKRGMA